MIKQIKKFQIKLTPFDATKEWAMSTTNNQDLLLMDDTASLDEEPVALEFIDYGNITSSHPFLNYECDIALEQQPDDLINTRMGLKVSGLFYPDTDPINEDKTYKRTVFSQVRTMFYNRYHDPTKTWGMDQIDFALGKTKRKLADEFRLFDFPQQIYGDKLIPNTIVIHDNSLDVDYQITDDGFGNLIAGSNLFSRQQEVSKHDNWYQDGYSTVCNVYFDFSPPSVSNLVATLTGTAPNFTASLTWNLSGGSIDGVVLQKSLDSGSTYLDYQFLGPVTSYPDTNVVLNGIYYYRVYSFNTVGTSSFSNTASIYINPLVAEEPWNEYTTGQSSSLNSGSGWTSEWLIGPSQTTIIAEETWDRFSVGSTPPLQLNNRIWGWTGAWTSSLNNGLLIVAEETWDEYTTGQTSSFSQGYGFRTWKTQISGS